MLQSYYDLDIWRQPHTDPENKHTYRMDKTQGEVNKRAEGTDREQLDKDISQVSGIFDRYYDTFILEMESLASIVSEAVLAIEDAEKDLMQWCEDFTQAAQLDQDFIQ